MPETLRAIGYSAFSGSALRSLTLPASLEGLGAYNFYGAKQLTSVDLSATKVRKLYDGTFWDTPALTSVKLPATIDSIGAKVWALATALPELDLSNTCVQTMSDSVFFGCSSLSSVTLPATLQTVGTGVLADCPAMERLSTFANVPPTANDFTFDGLDTEACVLVVPEGKAGDYAAATGWRDFTHVEATLPTAIAAPVVVDGDLTAELRGTQGAVEVRVEGGGTAVCRLFTLGGAAVTSVPVAADGTWHRLPAALSPGIYLATFTLDGSTVTHKVAVR